MIIARLWNVNVQFLCVYKLPSTEMSWMAKRRIMVQIIPSVIFKLLSTISAKDENNSLEEFLISRKNYPRHEVQSLIMLGQIFDKLGPKIIWFGLLTLTPTGGLNTGLPPSGCVRLASLGRPRSAHSGEPLTRANRTITFALSWWQHAPQVTPKWPTPQAGHWGLTQVSPSKLFERTGTDRGRPREA